MYELDKTFVRARLENALTDAVTDGIFSPNMPVEIHNALRSRRIKNPLSLVEGRAF
jgi:hypothetical protein